MTTANGIPSVKVENLSKSVGSVRIVENLNFSLHRGEVTGFIGRNGAGKTTTIRLLTGLLRPTGGQIKYNDIPTDGLPRLANVAFVPEQPAFYRHRSGYENLKIMLNGAYLPYDHAEAQRILAEQGIEMRAHNSVASFSKGMRLRLSLTHAIMRGAEVFIFDEPTEGLDPFGIKMFRQLIRELADAGGTVLFSSHIISEVEKTCDRVIIIDGGKIASEGTIDELYDQSHHLKYSVKVVKGDSRRSEAKKEVDAVLKMFGKKAAVNPNNGEVEITTHTGEAISKMLFEAGIFPSHITPLHRDLEQLFSQISENA